LVTKEFMTKGNPFVENNTTNKQLEIGKPQGERTRQPTRSPLWGRNKSDHYKAAAQFMENLFREGKSTQKVQGNWTFSVGYWSNRKMEMVKM